MMNSNLYKWIPFFLIIILISCKKDPVAYKNKSQNKNTEEALIEVNRLLIKKDQEKIKNFINKKGWQMKQSKTGLWYEIHKSGQGDSAKQGLIATINYKCSLLDGTVCYTSDTDGPKSFLIGKGNIETGLEEGILYLREGSVARYILPPYLAYGLPGDGKKIPARAIIVYEIKLLSLKSPK